MKAIGVIPARYGSSRFPGKPLQLILGKPMIQWVYEAAIKSECIDEVIVATDDERILKCVEAFHGNVVMTGECSCGTERVYEAVKDIPCDIVVNIQGDEPLIISQIIDKLIQEFFDEKIVMATLKRKIIDEDEVGNCNVVKVITDLNSDAIYFSRSIVPFHRNKEVNHKVYAHIGIYAYTKEFLEQYVSMKTTYLESVEQLEQLRVIENGYKIRVIETEYKGIGVDVPEDIAKIERCLMDEEIYQK